MRIHREGYSTLTVISIILIVINLLMIHKRISYLILLLSMLIWGFVARFFRNPSRHTPNIPDAVFAPADGTIVDIQPIYESEYFESERLKISIYMSALNVHVNRVPFEGNVNYVKVPSWEIPSGISSESFRSE